jgi:hypothetical protein
MPYLSSAGSRPNPRCARLRLVPVLLALILVAATGALPAAAAPVVSTSPSGAAAAAPSPAAALVTWLGQLLGFGGDGPDGAQSAPGQPPAPTLQRTGGPAGPLIDPNGQSQEPPAMSGFQGGLGGGFDGHRGF